MVDLIHIYRLDGETRLSIVDGSKRHDLPLNPGNIRGILHSLAYTIAPTLGGNTVPTPKKPGRPAKARAAAKRAAPVKRGPGRPRKTVSPDAKVQDVEPRRSVRVRPADKYRVRKRVRVRRPQNGRG
jgi:hypothetical protein